MFPLVNGWSPPLRTGWFVGRIKVHNGAVSSMDFSPDGVYIVTVSSAPNDHTVKFWNTKTWAQTSGDFNCGRIIRCVRFARSGVHALAIATDQDIQIVIENKVQAKFKGHSHGTLSLAWSPDGKRLLSGGDDFDPSIREWDTLTWAQVGRPWTGHTYKVNAIAVNFSGTHAVSGSSDNTVRIWQLSDKQTIAIFQHTSSVICAAFSADGTHIVSGGYDKKVTDWAAPKGILPVDVSKVIAGGPGTIYHESVSATVVTGSDRSTGQAVSTTTISASNSQQSFSAAHEESVSKAEQSVTKSQQSVSQTLTSTGAELSATGSSDSKSVQAVVVGSDSASLQGVSATESSVQRSASTSTSSTSNSQESSSSVQSVSSTLVNTIAGLSTIGSSAQQAVSTTASSVQQSASTTASSASNSQQSSSAVQSASNTLVNEISDSKSQQAVSTAASVFSNSQQSTSAIQSAVSESSAVTKQSAVSEQHSAVSDRSAISKQSVVNASSAVSEHSAVSQHSAVSASSAVSEHSAVSQHSAVSASPAVSEHSAVSQQSAVSASSAVSEHSAISEHSAVSQQSAVRASSAVSEHSAVRASSAISEHSVIRKQAAVSERSVSTTLVNTTTELWAGNFNWNAISNSTKSFNWQASSAFSSQQSQVVSKKFVNTTTSELLSITETIRTASITGNLSSAVKVLTQEIATDANNFASYVNRSFVLARTHDWENALQDATKSLALQMSFAGYIAKGIALCGKQQIEEATIAFDMAFTFTQGNMDATVFLYLVKAIALFNANRHKWALQRVESLAGDPAADPFVCAIVLASLRIQLGTIAFNSAHHSEAVEHFTSAVRATTFLTKSPVPAACEAFTVLFGWDMGALWETSNRHLIQALLGAGKLGEAFESYRFAMNASNQTTKTNLYSWILTVSL